MAYSKYTIIKNNGDKIINYKSNFKKAKKAFEKLQSKYKKVKIQYDTSLMNCVVSYFETKHGNVWRLEEAICPFGNL